MHLSKTSLAGALACMVLVAPAAHAQMRTPGGAVELSVGHAGFLDDAWISHTLIGGSARWYLTRRLAVGPEIVYMVGPRHDRDLFITGNLSFDIRGPSPAGQPRFVPYLVVGGGWFQHSDRFGPMAFTSNEGAFTGGGGARVWIVPNVYVAGEVRIGWEPHVRYSGHVGLKF